MKIRWSSTKYVYDEKLKNKSLFQKDILMVYQLIKLMIQSKNFRII